MKETKRDGKIRRALSSVDGKTWEQGGRDAGGKALPRESAWPTSQEDRESVVKMVVGKLVKEGAEGSWDELIDVFQEDVGGYFPNLQYLHVWGLGRIDQNKSSAAVGGARSSVMSQSDLHRQVGESGDSSPGAQELWSTRLPAYEREVQ